MKDILLYEEKIILLSEKNDHKKKNFNSQKFDLLNNDKSIGMLNDYGQ